MIKLVVVNENVLGYMIPKTYPLIGILRASPLRGSMYNDFSAPITAEEKDIRLASEKDFDVFGVDFDDYRDSDEYEYKST